VNRHSANTYLATRTSVLAGRLLDGDGIQQLAESSLDDLGRRFKLADLFESQLPQGRINRAVERAMIRTLMSELEVLLRPIEGNGRDTLIFWTRKFELYNLKALIRGKIQDQPYDQVEQNLLELPELISLPHDKLLRTESIPELLRQLDNGPYGGIARQARRVYERMNEPFSLDATIDLHYYMGLVKRAQASDNDDKGPLLRLIRVLIDQQNLTWLLRYRFTYGLSPSRTFYLLVPYGLHLHRDHLKALVNLETVARVIESLPEPFASSMQGVETILDARKILDRETRDQVEQLLHFSASAVTRALAYLILREMDLLKVQAVIQGRVLKLEDKLIWEALDLPIHNHGEVGHA
jgi:V/A-type H+-transporting ATPase subunit C